MPAPMKNTAPVYPLRLPESLDRALRQQAKAERRPLNALIADMLAEQLGARRLQSPRPRPTP
jgi:hypothetical protein